MRRIATMVAILAATGVVAPAPGAFAADGRALAVGTASCDGGCDELARS